MSAATPRCRSCGSARVESRGRKPGRFIQREFDFFSCAECGLLFVEPFAGFEIYNDAYYRGHGPDPFVDYEEEYRDWRRTDRGLEFDDLARIADEFFQENPPHAPIAWLDFGCGAGGFLKYLRERGTFRGQPLQLTGHDLGSYAELLARADGFRILGLDALAREPDAHFDVISLIEVIEHLPAPAEAIALVARLLKPGGLLLLTTGNMDGRIARRQGIHYRYCAPEIHVSLFNPRSLAQLYRRFGLAPRAVRYRGAVAFKVVKSLRHRAVQRALARAALSLPPFVRLVDWLYGVSAMPCAVKSQSPHVPTPKKSP